jgi:acyl-CoA thioester hydrolase
MAERDPGPRGHTLQLRVYWEDTDAGGIVYYANYLKFFERARTEWLRARGIDQRALHERDGLLFVVAAAELRCRISARLDDVLQVTARLQLLGRARLDVAHTAWRGDVQIADGSVRIGCVDAASRRPCRIPDRVVQALA